MILSRNSIFLQKVGNPTKVEKMASLKGPCQNLWALVQKCHISFNFYVLTPEISRGLRVAKFRPKVGSRRTTKI